MELTLLKLFEREETNFQSELSQIILPKDEQKLIVFLRKFFIDKVSVEEYKNELTMGEVAMLNSVLKLYTSQILLFSSDTSMYSLKNTVPDTASDDTTGNAITTLGYTAAGGAIGTFLFKQTWGGVLLTVAACALGLYMSNKKHSQENSKAQIKIDASKYISTLKNVCRSIDDIILNYRVGINNVKESYEKKEQVTLASAYRPLLDRIASMYAALKGLNVSAEINDEINRLYRTLKNFHYDIVDYSEATMHYYEQIESDHVVEFTLLKAAILEDGRLLIKGECLTPKN